MKYTFGQLDLDAAKTRRTPLFQAILKDKIEPLRLRNAITSALVDFPIFSCHFVGKNKEKTLLTAGLLGTDNRYAYLENGVLQDASLGDGYVEPVVWHASIENRPVLGLFEVDHNNVDYYNDALYQFCWYENYVTFEWLPLLTDTHVALAFFTAVLEVYCGPKRSARSVNRTVGFEDSQTEIKDGLITEVQAGAFEKTAERAFDPTVKPVGQVGVAEGYKREAVPILPSFTCHVLHFNLKDILKVSRKDSTSVMAVLVAVLARALCQDAATRAAEAATRAAEALKNNGTTSGAAPGGGVARVDAVSTAFYLDARAALGFDTARVATYRKTIAYETRMNRYPFTEVATIIRHAIDVFYEKENLQSYVPSKTATNLDVEHAGTLAFSSRVLQKLDDFRMIEMPKTADAMLTSALLGKQLVVCLTERFEPEIFERFIALCNAESIAPEIVEKFTIE